ncbi:MAG TPA: S-layer homology domain-containing protein, partial [Candidatus Evtepia excrementipullorum]|nr:S-layer homology domain-containing protein [Candidatus Evtepia excrementipullorum]
MTLWKKAVALLLAVAMMVPLALAAPSTEGSFSDVEDHWAQAEIEKAVATGWVDGYPDGTFKPEKTITRAEFTKMILDATHLTPGCETVAWMKDHAKIKVKGTGPWPDTVDYEPRLNDMDNHWLTTQGWTEAALYSGMVVPSDYNGGNFRPEKPIARYE